MDTKYRSNFIAELYRFIRFSIVGVGNTTIDFGLYFIFTRVFHLFYLYANSLSWLVAVCFSFFVNKFWTFNSYGGKRIMTQYVKFFIVSGIALGLSLGLLYVLVDRIGLSDLIAKICIVVMVVFWNFFANKFWTFKHAA